MTIMITTNDLWGIQLLLLLVHYGSSTICDGEGQRGRERKRERRRQRERQNMRTMERGQGVRDIHGGGHVERAYHVRVYFLQNYFLLRLRTHRCPVPYYIVPRTRGQDTWTEIIHIDSYETSLSRRPKRIDYTAVQVGRAGGEGAGAACHQ